MVEVEPVNGHSSPELVAYETGTKPEESMPCHAAVLANLTGYVGKRISVISKTENRYEGLLKEIDEKTATASIHRVRFWGTEIRQTPVVAQRPETYELVKFRLNELKDIFAHVERCPEMEEDSAVTECSVAIVPIMWANFSEYYAENFVLPDERGSMDPHEAMTAEEWNMVMVDKDEAIRLLRAYQGTRNRISIISKSLIRYEGLLRTLDEETTQISLVCVRFLGTEDRPAVKKAEARNETYPNVKFQLGEARDIKAFVKMCDEMMNDRAVISQESSVGFVSAARKRLPAALPTPRPVSTFEMMTENGKLQVRLPERSPTKDGRIILAMPQGSASPGRASRFHSLVGTNAGGKELRETPGRVSSLYRSLTAGTAASGDMTAYDPSLPLPGVVVRKRRARTQQEKPKKQRTDTSSTADGEEDPGDEDDTGTTDHDSSPQKTLQVVSRLSPNKRGRGRGRHPRQRQSTANHKMENGSHDGSTPSNGRNGSTAVIVLPYSGVGKIQCPLGDGCIEEYPGATNVHVMEAHFSRTHNEMPPCRFLLQCSICQETGLSNVTAVRAHVAQKHGQQNGDDIPVGHEEELEEPAKEDDGTESG